MLGIFIGPVMLQALEKIAQLDRVISKPGGAALLCGRAGVGRKSALALVAYMHHMEVCAAPISAWHVQQLCSMPLSIQTRKMLPALHISISIFCTMFKQLF